MAVRVVDGIMSKKPSKHYKSAIRMIEEAFFVLRTAPGSLLTYYYLGGVPFVLGLLYFWADMSRSANAHRHIGMAALGLAVLFVWLKFWQTVFALRVRAQVSDQGLQPWTLGRIAAIAATQSLIQSTRFIVMPIASLMLIPYGFCYAFYQNVSAVDDGEIQDLSSTCKWAWHQAGLWPRQNHLLIGIYWLFGFVVLVNLAIAAVLIPQLVKTLLGVDSMFTMSGMRMILNTTFWTAMFGMTYLLVDPFIKTTYALRCFYGSALKSGQDLKTELNQILSEAKKTATALLVVLLVVLPLTSMGEPSTPVTPAELDQSIEEIMGRREFSWRMPRDARVKQDQAAPGPIEAAMQWLLDLLAKGLKKIGEWIQQLIEWLEGLLPEPGRQKAAAGGSWITPVRVIMILLVIFLLGILAFVCVQIWRRRRTKLVPAVSSVAAPTPDLADESIKADDLSTNRWLALAAEFTEKGELRLAMRALYLATLAHLAENDMITIEVYKSNREYELELMRRAHEHKEMLQIFSKSLNFFERAWYGMYRIARPDFDAFTAEHKRILAFAAK
jgi:hypothetical protein